jgi:hypothetical protein
MPTIIGVRGLGDVRNGQWFGRGQPIAETKKRDSDRASTK